MAKKKFDAKAWAGSQTVRRGGRRCCICSNAAAATACDEVAQIWISQRPAGLSFAAIAEMLEEEFGLSISQGTVNSHFRKHRPQLYGRIRGG